MIISDTLIGEIQIEKVSSKSELNSLTNFLLNLNDDSIQFEIRKKGINTTDAMKIGGVEGGGGG